ncbi:MAG: ABC transporter ATP-binding protein, partial [Alloprevotella sp.]|nr:ABC transporter ATP-binding protein [Alloprevotella sp.]
IVVSHDRDFLDGLVEKVYEFGGGKVREHLGGIYDFLEKKQLETLDQLHTAGSPSASQAQPKAEAKAAPSEGKLSYEEQKEQARKRRKAEKLVEQMEARVMALEEEKAELEANLSTPEGASDQKLFERYAQLGRELKEAEAAWEEALEALE